MPKKVFIILITVLLLCSCTQTVELPDDPTLPTAETQSTSDSTTEPSQEATPTQPDEDKSEKRISFLGCGDNIVYYGNVLEAASVASDGRRYDFRPTYAGVAPMIESADIAMINQETLMADGIEYSYYPKFNGPQEMGINLTELGFDVVSIANNHMLDKDSAGLSSTIDFWRTQPVALIGGYHTEEEYNSLNIVEKGGIRVAFLSYTYGTNGLTSDGAYPVVIPLLNEQTVPRQVSAAKEQADLVIVSVHWGVEDSFTPTSYQKYYAQLMADAGADVIVGHHPHVIQPIEWITGNSGNKTLCVYSLGNFAAEQAYDYNMLGGMISFDIVKTSGETHIEKPLFHPTVYFFNRYFYGNYIFPLDDFLDKHANSHGIQNYENTITVEKIREYLTSTISPEFLE